MNEGLELQTVQVDEAWGMNERQWREAIRDINRACRRMERQGRLSREPVMDDVIRASIRETEGKKRLAFRDQVLRTRTGNGL